MNRRIELARLALHRVLITQRAAGLVSFDARELDALVERQLSALLPALGLAEKELAELEEELKAEAASESHGARRTGGLLTLLALALWTGCSGAELGANQVPVDGAPVTVYLIAGQSNAAGGANTSDLPAELAWYATPFDMPWAQELQCPKDYSGGACTTSTGWGPQVKPRANGAFGVELSAGRALLSRFGPDVALLKHATNGSNLFAQWDTGTANSLWTYLVAYTDARLAELPAGSTVGGLLWIQGGSDADSTVERAGDYAENLAYLVAKLRARYGPLAVVVDRLPVFFEATNGDLVRAAQSDVAATLDDVVVVETGDLGPARDSPGAHYRAEAFITLGERMVGGLP